MWIFSTVSIINKVTVRNNGKLNTAPDGGVILITYEMEQRVRSISLGQKVGAVLKASFQWTALIVLRNSG